jgi:hypothetical protein
VPATKEAANVAYETKVILMSLAQHAVMLNSADMYKIIANLANVEGVVLKPWEEARAEYSAAARDAQQS